MQIYVFFLDYSQVESISSPDYHFALIDGCSVVMTRGINLILRGPDKTDDKVNILNNWYWYSTGGRGVKFVHEFSFQ